MFSLIGNGSHGADILAIAKRRGFQISVFDDNPERGEKPPADLSGYVIFGTYYPEQRRELSARFPDASPSPPLTDISTVISADSTVGNGSVVGHQTALVSSVSLGSHVHVGYHVGLTRTNVGDYTTISPGAIICGDCQIGEAVFIGANATICDRSVIGNNVVIGAGAIIPPCSRVPDGTRVLGVWK